MSLLRDTKGRRPPSNADAVRLYENMAKLPSFRNKYDWNSNIWSEDQIKLLHLKVKQVLQRLALDSVVATYKNIDFDVKNNIANTIKSINTNHLYHYLVEDPYHFLEAVPPAPPFAFVKITSGIFWNLVIDHIDQQKNFSKIPLDCHIKYLNSNADGTLRVKLTPKQMDKLNNIMKNDDKINWIDAAKKIGCTPYQCYLYFVKNVTSGDSSNWTDELDKKLINAVSRSIGKRVWHEVAQEVGNNKTNEQCRLRWSRVLSKRSVEGISPVNINKKLQEDIKFLVDIYGKTNWTLIARHVNLTDKQCRSKYFACVSDNLSNSDKMKQLIQTIIDSDWQLDKVKRTLGIDITVCKRKWARLDPLGYYIYKTCSHNISNRVGDTQITNKLMDHVKSMLHKEALLERVNMLKRKKLPIKKIYKSIDCKNMVRGFKILHCVLGDSVLKLEAIVTKNFNWTTDDNVYISNETIKNLPEDWLDVVSEMLERLWPIPSVGVMSIVNKL